MPRFLLTTRREEVREYVDIVEAESEEAIHRGEWERVEESSDETVDSGPYTVVTVEPA